MTGERSDTPGTAGTVPSRIKVNFIRGILLFYAVNLFAVVCGAVAIDRWGNLPGIVFMVCLMFLLQAVCGYLVLRKSEEVMRD